MFGMGAQELMLILLIALVLFGGSKIPELGPRSDRRSASSNAVWRHRTRPPKPKAESARGRSDRSRRDAGVPETRMLDTRRPHP